jgi:hypothetical protein
MLRTAGKETINWIHINWIISEKQAQSSSGEIPGFMLIAVL